MTPSPSIESTLKKATSPHTSAAPAQIAYLPFLPLPARQRGGYRCVSAKFISGRAVPRASFGAFFGEACLASTDNTDWPATGG